jgi:23S rRNA (adenine-N6)-dimethyltransferase
MKYKQRRRLYSQNFLRSPKLIAKLIRLSSIGKKDTVIEIGPGKGIITTQLLKSATKVIAVELDSKLHLHLQNTFKNEAKLNILNADFLQIDPPKYNYKVFSNIPFSITADIIRKLTSDKFMTEAYLIVQKEAAMKFMGMPFDKRNQMMSTLLKPWFKINVIWKFKRSNFAPIPSVAVVMIKIKRKKIPDVPTDQKVLYEHFVIFEYNRHKVSRLGYKLFLDKFNHFAKNVSDHKKKKIVQLAREIRSKQASVQKIHRTRLDKKWKKFN